jgi:endonuclease/exonuclease/phosphatase family metal-dependent hydrolase
MINALCKAGVLTSVIALSAISIHAQYGDTVKIMTYNINYETNKNTQYDGIISVIKEINPTIAGLQKLDSCMGTGSNPCYVAKLIGDQTNMSYTFVTADPKEYGDGFLTKQPPKSVRKILLTGSATYPRAALEIGVTVGGEPVRVIVTHLDLSAANRTSEMKQIISWMDSGGAKTIPAVIMADFNAGPTEDCMTQLTDVGFVFLKTSTGAILDTAQKINHILYRPENRWKIVDIGNPKYAASNRYPLWGLMSLLNPVNTTRSDLGFVNTQNEKLVRISGRTITYNLPHPSIVSMQLIDARGRIAGFLIREQKRNAGTYSIDFNRKKLTSGIYFICLNINGIAVVENIPVF